MAVLVTLHKKQLTYLFTENFSTLLAWCRAKNELANNVTSATYRVQHTTKMFTFFNNSFTVDKIS